MRSGSSSHRCSSGGRSRARPHAPRRGGPARARRPGLVCRSCSSTWPVTTRRPIGGRRPNRLHQEAILLARESGQTTDMADVPGRPCLVEARLGREDDCRPRRPKPHGLQSARHTPRGDLRRPAPSLTWSLPRPGREGRAGAGGRHRAAGRPRRGRRRPLAGPGAGRGAVWTGDRPGPRRCAGLPRAGRREEAAVGDGEGRARPRGHVPPRRGRRALPVCLRAAPGTGDLYERARTELSFGRRLRRRSAGPTHGSTWASALQAFEWLGAQPWADQCAVELAAGGGTGRHGRGRPRVMS